MNYNTEIILSEIFDTQSSIYPLIIIKSPFYPRNSPSEHYFGIHFQETASLLSIKDEEIETIIQGFSQEGKKINLAEKKADILFTSIEIELWAREIISGSLLELLKCVEPPCLQDLQFEEFKQIAREHQNYRLLLNLYNEIVMNPKLFATNMVKSHSYNKQVEEKLDKALLNLRRNLF